MASNKRERLMRRAEALRRLFEGFTDSMTRAAITEEIAKHETLIAEIDNRAVSEEAPAEQSAEIIAKAPRDIC
jgi:uncharacterized protein (DUF2342 family)